MTAKKVVFDIDVVSFDGKRRLVYPPCVRGILTGIQAKGQQGTDREAAQQQATSQREKDLADTLQARVVNEKSARKGKADPILLRSARRELHNAEQGAFAASGLRKFKEGVKTVFSEPQPQLPLEEYPHITNWSVITALSESIDTSSPCETDDLACAQEIKVFDLPALHGINVSKEVVIDEHFGFRPFDVNVDEEAPWQKELRSGKWRAETSPDEPSACPSDFAVQFVCSVEGRVDPVFVVLDHVCIPDYDPASKAFIPGARWVGKESSKGSRSRPVRALGLQADKGSATVEGKRIRVYRAEHLMPSALRERGNLRKGQNQRDPLSFYAEDDRNQAECFVQKTA